MAHDTDAMVKERLKVEIEKKEMNLIQIIRFRCDILDDGTVSNPWGFFRVVRPCFTRVNIGARCYDFLLSLAL